MHHLNRESNLQAFISGATAPRGALGPVGVELSGQELSGQESSS